MVLIHDICSPSPQCGTRASSAFRTISSSATSTRSSASSSRPPRLLKATGGTAWPSRCRETPCGPGKEVTTQSPRPSPPRGGRPRRCPGSGTPCTRGRPGDGVGQQGAGGQRGGHRPRGRGACGGMWRSSREPPWGGFARRGWAGRWACGEGRGGGSPPSARMKKSGAGWSGGWLPSARRGVSCRFADGFASWINGSADLTGILSTSTHACLPSDVACELSHRLPHRTGCPLHFK